MPGYFFLPVKGKSEAHAYYTHHYSGTFLLMQQNDVPLRFYTAE